MPVKGEEGFTLIELLVALAIGMIVVMAGFQALDSFGVANATITTRTDNTQRARLEMDGLVRALRSQACRGPGIPSLVAASPTSVSFVTDLGDGTVPLQLRTVTFDPAARRLSEDRFAGQTPPPSATFSGSSTPGPTLSGVEQIDAATPVFGFYAFDTASPPRPTVALSNTLSAADLARVAMISVAFRVGPAADERDRETGANLSSQVLLRSVDPSDPAPVPLCS